MTSCFLASFLSKFGVTPRLLSLSHALVLIDTKKRKSHVSQKVSHLYTRVANCGP